MKFGFNWIHTKYTHKVVVFTNTVHALHSLSVSLGHCSLTCWPGAGGADFRNSNRQIHLILPSKTDLFNLINYFIQSKDVWVMMLKHMTTKIKASFKNLHRSLEGKIKWVQPCLVYTFYCSWSVFLSDQLFDSLRQYFKNMAPQRKTQSPSYTVVSGTCTCVCSTGSQEITRTDHIHNQLYLWHHGGCGKRTHTRTHIYRALVVGLPTLIEMSVF